LILKGFELIATGGYSADDALRTVTALGLTTRKNRPVPRQTWHAILRNPLYAGWVKSGDLFVRGVHQPIVPQQLFDAVQEVLAGRSRTAQPRQTIHPEFSLRQFVRCEKCNKGLTAGIIKKKFFYYWCYTKGCRDVLVSAQELEQHFVRLLSMYQPTVELLEQLPDIAKRQWEAREERIRQDSKALRIRLEDIRRLNSAAIKAKLKGELSAEDFDSLKATNAQDSAEIEKQLTALESEKNMMQELMEQSQRELVDLVGAWRKAGITGRKELQTALFPEGLVWSHESGFLNRKNVGLMNDLDEFFQSLKTSSTSLDEFLVRFGVPDGI
jgi:site-specific DNA recombinase